MPYKDPAVAKQKKAEYYQENKEAIKKKVSEYQQENKETIAERKKEYRQANKEVIAERASQYHQENRETILEQKAKYRKENKENITYIATVGSDFYFGHSSIGLNARRGAHFCSLKKGKGNPGLQKHFNKLGKEAFKKIFNMQILGTFETVDEAKAEETYLLTKYVGTPGCLNVNLA